MINQHSRITLFCFFTVLGKVLSYGPDTEFEVGEELPYSGEQEVGVINDLIAGAGGEGIFNPCPGHATGPAGEAFANLINTMLISECLLAPPCAYPTNVGDNCMSKTIFDFIVVGAGTAGSVIASRLSEVPEWNILLLEAGNDPPMTSDVPMFHRTLQRTDIDWMHRTVREEGLFNGLMGRVNRWPLGKTMGGTSTIGSMLYVRASQKDMDNIAANGNVGWAYDDVMPYYLKSEDMREYAIISNRFHSCYHKRGGPLTISRFGFTAPIIDLIQNASEELGIFRLADINGYNTVGYSSPNPGTVRNGERVNTAKAFLNPIKSRKNLFVVKSARVTKIHICPQTKRAYGVEYYYRTESSPRTLRASREIIVCCGTVNSPRLLMYSGVGPKNLLELNNIYVIHNLRVGRNLRDTVTFPFFLMSLNFGAMDVPNLQTLDYAYEYLTRRTGPLAGLDSEEVLLMLDTFQTDSPNVQLRFIYARADDTEVINNLAKAYGIDEDITLQIMDILKTQDLIISQVSLLHPLSVGVVSLDSNDPFDMPLIKSNYLEHPKDLDDMVYGIRFLERLSQTAAMKAFNTSLEYLYFPGCCGIDYGTDYYWSCALSHLAGTGYNPVGTCKMGPCEDPDAVVDPQLRVQGIKGLRVADASILPKTLTGPIMATVIMIGEKVSDMIKFQWLPDYKPCFFTRSPFPSPSTLMHPERQKSQPPYVLYLTPQ